ncbi:MAG: hemerythrin domain-containing protein [Myxococcota bacterium]
MRPGEVRERLLSENDHIRVQLAWVEDTAHRLSHNHALIQEVRDAATDLVHSMQEHVDFEDIALAPMLREAEAWGEARADELTKHHQQQQEKFKFAIDGIERHRGDPDLLSQRVLRLAHDIRSEVDEEETKYFGSTIFRDDIGPN